MLSNDASTVKHVKNWFGATSSETPSARLKTSGLSRGAYAPIRPRRFSVNNCDFCLRRVQRTRPAHRRQKRFQFSDEPGATLPARDLSSGIDSLEDAVGISETKRAPKVATAAASNESSRKPYSAKERYGRDLNSEDNLEKSRPFCFAPPTTTKSKELEKFEA